MLTGQSLKPKEYVFNLGAFTCKPCGGHVVVSRKPAGPLRNICSSPLKTLLWNCVCGAALNSDSLTNQAEDHQDSRTDPAHRQLIKQQEGRRNDYRPTLA